MCLCWFLRGQVWSGAQRGCRDYRLRVSLGCIPGAGLHPGVETFRRSHSPLLATRGSS